MNIGIDDRHLIVDAVGANSSTI